MAVGAYELPVSQHDLKDDVEKKSRNKGNSSFLNMIPPSIQYNINKLKRLLGFNVGKNSNDDGGHHYKIFNIRRIVLILFIVTFSIFWLADSGSDESVSSLIKEYERRRNSNSRGLRTPLGQSSIPNSLANPNRSRWSKIWPFSLLNKDPKIVIILAANEGGGVLRWKNEEEWFIEKISIDNKKAYAKRHGYGLTIKDLTVSKRYSHEYREGWQKIDILKQSMREFPNAEWFWWLDLDTLIMEPKKSLEDHIFNRIDQMTERTLEEFNPLNIPIDLPYVDYKQDMNLLITQDCGGFNLGSFFIKNSEWSKLLLDVWWEPVMYEQRHMVWDHREQDALEELYRNEAWIRSKVGFLPLRAINSFPPGACSESNDDPRYFYNEHDRDFVVNMAGCNFGRDCWGEMKHYTSTMERLNTRWYSKLFRR
ncbi:hypothetical protein TBLA_0A01680 [Henningerozyma blattae CBS 6284]|uniref:Uncharacterized protein n=1 Tax=Henningerozyma blattae (strain ATCC 34711 / CBS 6284 / DSM 70876 / NBRC 10599 / NRRL Y-10934 / UCD 77-7) TaxID=1071380 RepID=I2GV16_HENB6|nr:hypothetical protein TBLA_0A01680 [Tetrapisispora blattae CBS 6284]CCH57968.1 hypothetical protein TBLA_0A01680 [Tetrapisispora blattae CBS 6284]